jgi:serine protease Do
LPGKRATIEGLTLEPLSARLKDKFGIPKEVSAGLVVTDVEHGSIGAFAGLRPGDVVLEVNRRAVAKPEDFKRAWERAEDRVLLLVQRRGARLFLVVRKPAT